jgi:hypothetical protein
MLRTVVFSVLGLVVCVSSLIISNLSDPFESKATNLYAGFESGSYTGNGVDNRVISGLPFKPDLVVIKGEIAEYGCIATSSMPSGQSKNTGGVVGLISNGIKALNSGSFTLGTADQVNKNGVVYHWFAMQNGALEMTCGKYTGNGVAGRNVVGTGFWPDMVWVLGSGTTTNYVRTSYMAAGNSNLFTGAANINRITSFTSDGFTVGNAAEVNTNGVEYYYVAFKTGGGTLVIGSYTGDGLANRIISASPFVNDFILIKGHGGTDFRWKSSTVSGARSLRMTNAYSPGEQSLVNIGNGIFTVMNDANVNQSGQTYTYLAFRKSTGGNAPLPITLLDFKAEPTADLKSIKVSWVTGTEVNNHYFTIERSADGKNWDEVDHVNGSGNSSSPISYNLTDYQPLDGTSYYRLRQTDYDGKTMTFQPVKVRLNNDGHKLMVYPNPASNQINVSWKNSDFSIIIYDQKGGEVLRFQNSSYGLDISKLNRGQYLLKVSDGENQETTRLVVTE